MLQSVPRRARSRTPVRSARSWATRAALAGAVAVIGGYATTFSIAWTAVARDPGLAHRLAPYDGRITAAYAATMASPEADASDRAKADLLAMRALRQAATAVAAASTLGLNAQISGTTAAARRYFGYAQRLSRREVQTQLWAIEDAVARGDIRSALDHYDIALRTTARGGDLFFPILAFASQQPQVRAELVRKLSLKPSWGEGFLNYLVGSGQDLRPAAALFVALRRHDVMVPRGAQAELVTGLVSSGRVEDAWSYYTTIHPGADRNRSRDPRFAANSSFSTSFDWVPTNDDGIATTIQGGLVDVSTSAGAGGATLRQMQLLPQGSYRLSGHSISVGQNGGSRFYWTLTCGRDGRELGRVDIPASTSANGRFAGMFTVPAGCPVQVLTLIARPSEGLVDMSAQFDSAELVPAR